MGFLKKFFGTAGDRLAPLRRAVQQKSWADALAQGESLGETELSEAERAELEQLLVFAGNALAELNLAEGELSLQSGDLGRAREHFQLAAAQARQEQLRERAHDLLRHARPVGKAAAPAKAAAEAASCCSAGCHAASEEVPADDLDADTRLDLILAGYPAAMAERYLQAGETFRAAFLRAHEGEDDEALRRFDQIAPGERDDLFFFERGSLLGRLGRIEQALADLEKAVALNPRHELARETLISLELNSGRVEAAGKHLEEMLAAGMNPIFCHGKRALLLAEKGSLSAALEEAQKAVAAGGDPESLHLAALLLEKTGRLDEAEVCYARLGSAGCGGGVNPHLAEFWLRQQKNYDKALDAFKRALRQEPANAHWMLRIAQVYVGQGWQKEGMPLLERALASPELDPELRREAEALLQMTDSSAI